VSFDPRLPDRVALDVIYPKFPAAGFLQPGDIIVACNGEKLHSRSAWVRLGAHIFSREPGETIAITIRRGAEKITYDIPLGQYGDLPTRGTPGGPGEDRLELAWEMRSRRFEPAARTPIDPNAQVVDWRPEPTHIETQKIVRSRAQLPPVYRAIRLVAGGEPRGGELDYDELVALQQSARGNVMFNRMWEQQRLAQGLGPNWAALSGMAQTTAQELSGLETRRLTIERQLEEVKLPGVMKPQQLTQMEERLQVSRDELTRIKRQIDAIKAEAAEDQAPDAQPPASAIPDGR
jgi:hypothetical protein